MALLIQDIVNIIEEYGDDPNITVAFASFDKSFDKKIMYPKLLIKKFGNNNDTLISNINTAFNIYFTDYAYVLAYYLFDLNHDFDITDNYWDIQEASKRGDIILLNYLLGRPTWSVIRNFCNQLLAGDISLDDLGNPIIHTVSQKPNIYRAIPDIVVNINEDYAMDIYSEMSDESKRLFDDYIKLWKIKKEYGKVN